MGLLDIIEKITEKTVETVVRLPEVPIRITKGIIHGVEEGLDKIGKALD